MICLVLLCGATWKGRFYKRSSVVLQFAFKTWSNLGQKSKNQGYQSNLWAVFLYKYGSKTILNPDQLMPHFSSLGLKQRKIWFYACCYSSQIFPIRICVYFSGSIDSYQEEDPRRRKKRLQWTNLKIIKQLMDEKNRSFR